jgi:hypothetical protein
VKIITSDSKKTIRKFCIIISLAIFIVIGCSLIIGENKELVLSSSSCDEIGEYFTEAKDTKGQEKFLKQFNIAVDSKSKSEDSVTIPKTFGTVYEEYNKLQKEIGLDLTSYKGREVSRVVYKIKDAESYVTLLIYKGHFIGGHISSGVYGEKYKPLI